MNKNDYLNKKECIIDSLTLVFCKSDHLKQKKVVYYTKIDMKFYTY